MFYDIKTLTGKMIKSIEKRWHLMLMHVMKGIVVTWSMKYRVMYYMMNKVNLLDLWVHYQIQIKFYALQNQWKQLRQKK
eukprot:6603757-Ditylum_brightwellii.AAC.1